MYPPRDLFESDLANIYTVSKILGKYFMSLQYFFMIIVKLQNYNILQNFLLFFKKKEEGKTTRTYSMEGVVIWC